MERGGGELPAGVRATIEQSLALLAADDIDGALAAIQQVASDLPGTSVPSHLIGLLSIRAGEPGKALDALTLAHKLAPETREHAEALGILHAKLGHVVDALYFGKLATASTLEVGLDGMVPAWLGTFSDAFFHIKDRPLLKHAEELFRGAHYAEAARGFRHVSEVEPDMPAAWRGLARSLLRTGRPYEALDATGPLLRLAQAAPEDLSLRGEILAELGRIDEAIDLQRQAAGLLPGDPGLAYAVIRTLARRAQPGDEALTEAAAAFSSRFALPLEKPEAASAAELAGRRLRVGVVSSWWGPGEGLDLVVPVLEQIDRRIVELIVYAEDPAKSALARRLRRRADRWHDIDELDDDTINFIMRNDAPDVLIDLDGPTRSLRPILFLARPAALMLTSHGVPSATTELGFDGVIGAPEAYPTNLATALRVPGGIVALPADLAPSLASSRDPEQPCVFGVLAPAGAITAATVALWRRILDAVPNATLQLDLDIIGGPKAAAALLPMLAAHLPDGRFGIGSVPEPLASYLSRIDILLDPLDNPYPDAAVAAVGLGVPVLTCRSEQPRAGLLAGWLTMLGFGDWVAPDAAALVYVARAAADGRREIAARMSAALVAERADGAARQAELLLQTLARAALAGRLQ